MKQRRLIRKELSSIYFRSLFDIKNDELIIDITHDRDFNKLIITVIKDFDSKKGDI